MPNSVPKSALPAGPHITWIDTAKAISIFVIVAGHCADKTRADILLLHLSMFSGVGVFFLLSGMTFCYAPGGDFPCFDNRKSVFFLKNLALRILFPYFIWGTISILIYALLGPFAASVLDSSRTNFDIGKNFLGLLYANSNANHEASGYMEWNRPLWFLPCLFLVEVIFFIFLKLLCRIRSTRLRTYLYTLSLVLPLAWLIFMSLSGITPRLPWEGETAFCVLFYFSLGRLLRIWMEQKESKGRSAQVPAKDIDIRKYLFLLISILLWVILILSLKGVEEADFRADHFSNPERFILQIPSGILATLLLAWSCQKVPALTYIGKRTMAILVMHKFAVMACKMVLKVSGTSAVLDETFAGVIAKDLLMASLTVLLCLAVEKPLAALAPWAFGKRRSS